MSLSDSEIVFPDDVGRVLGRTASQVRVLYEFDVLAKLVKQKGCTYYYFRSELIAFREASKVEPMKSRIDYLLGLSEEN